MLVYSIFRNLTSILLLSPRLALHFELDVRERQLFDGHCWVGYVMGCDSLHIALQSRSYAPFRTVGNRDFFSLGLFGEQGAIGLRL